MRNYKIGKIAFILLATAFGTFFFSLFFFQESSVGSLKRGFLYFVGIVLIVLYIRLFISIVKGYFMHVTESIYFKWTKVNTRMDIGLFRIACALGVPMALVLAAWIASGLI